MILVIVICLSFFDPAGAPRPLQYKYAKYVDYVRYAQYAKYISGELLELLSASASSIKKWAHPVRCNVNMLNMPNMSTMCDMLNMPNIYRASCSYYSQRVRRTSKTGSPGAVEIESSFPDRQIQLPARLIYLPVLSSREFSSQPIVFAARSSTESRPKRRFLKNSL